MFNQAQIQEFKVSHTIPRGLAYVPVTAYLLFPFKEHYTIHIYFILFKMLVAHFIPNDIRAFEVYQRVTHPLRVRCKYPPVTPQKKLFPHFGKMHF